MRDLHGVALHGQGRPGRGDARRRARLRYVVATRPFLLTLLPGHVLHEKCLLEWFDSQIQQYIATARERGWEHEHDPGPEDVPVECPQCRTEVYGDDDGKPLIHRLYVNFGEASAHAASSSQIHSSPMGPRATQHWGNPVEREALGLARRARNAADEIGALGAQSNPDEMNGTLRRVGKLQEDVLSAKASQGFKVS